MRKRYETSSDVHNEKIALNVLLKHLKRDETTFTWDREGKKVGVDATLYKDESFHCQIEVKTRDPKFFDLAKSDGYILASQKWDKLVSLDARLLVYWRNQDVYAVRPSQVENVEFKRGGRTKQTRDEWDVEKMAIIPWGAFTFIGEVPLDSRWSNRGNKA